MSANMPPAQWRTIDGLKIRFVSTPGRAGNDILLLSPWPESLFGFSEIWEKLSRHGRIERYSLYVFDYRAATGFRLAVAVPDRVTAIVSQSGNA